MENDNVFNGTLSNDGYAIFGSNIFSKTEEKILSTNEVYLFTAGIESDISPQVAELKVKAKANILGLKKTRIEVIDLTGKEIVNKIPTYNYSEIQHGSYRMNYINFDYNEVNGFDFISSGASILELQENNSNNKIGICLFAYSYEDNLDGLSTYLTDGLMELYSTGYSTKYSIVNFHTAVEGFNPTKKFATVIAGIVD